MEEPYTWRSKRWALALGMTLLSIVITLPTWVDTFQLGMKDKESGYVLLAPFVVAWLVWVRRGRLTNGIAGGGGWMGVMLVGVGWLMWSYGYRRSAPTLWHAGPVFVAAGTLLSVAGIGLFKKLIPAFVAMLFLVPITPTRRQIIAAPLEQYASQWTQTACELLGLHVNRFGNVLSVNDTDVEVAEACNGMRQVITFWLVCYVIAFSRPLRWPVRGALLLAVPFIAIVSNVIRLIPTVWMYSHGAGSAAERFHDAMGWVMLACAFAFIHLLIAALQWASAPVGLARNKA